MEAEKRLMKAARALIDPKSPQPCGAWTGAIHLLPCTKCREFNKPGGCAWIAGAIAIRELERMKNDSSEAKF